MTTAFATLLVGIAGAALVLAIVCYLWVNRSPSRTERFDQHGRVPLFLVDVESAQWAAAAARVTREEAENADSVPEEAASLAGDGSTDAPAPHQQSELDGSAWAPAPGWPVIDAPAPNQRPLSRPPVTPVATPITGRPVPPFAAPPFAERAGHGNGSGVYGNGAAGSMVEGHGVRFSIPAEGTLQFLPGRLEITSGMDAGREIRFVRVPGPNGTEVTFGRNEGPPYRHIQLRDQTVSREHARMSLHEGRWHLSNLSRTNPVAYNGRVLSYGEQQLLEDGDRIEMGEVVFSFRSR